MRWRGGETTDQCYEQVEPLAREQRVRQTTLGRHHVGVALGLLRVGLGFAERGAVAALGARPPGRVRGWVEACGFLERAGVVCVGFAGVGSEEVEGRALRMWAEGLEGEKGVVCGMGEAESHSCVFVGRSNPVEGMESVPSSIGVCLPGLYQIGLARWMTKQLFFPT